MHTRRLAILLAAVLALALWGCGQKGPLYFPESEEDDFPETGEIDEEAARPATPAAPLA